MSDGSSEPGLLPGLCRAAGLTVMAVTDHDTTEGWAPAMHAAAACGLECLPGVEITAVLDGRDVHILGYFPSPRVPILDEFLADQRQDRLRRVRAMVGRLADLGMPLDLSPVLADAGRNPRRTIGRPQIADALIAAGFVSSRDDAFARYLGYGCPAFVPRAGATPEDVVGLIGAAGGLASLAHPGLLDRDDLLPALILAGLPAIEVFHADHDAEATARYLRLAVKSRLLVTGGSDFHGTGAGHHENMLGRVVLPREHYDAFAARLRS